MCSCGGACGFSRRSSGESDGESEDESVSETSSAVDSDLEVEGGDTPGHREGFCMRWEAFFSLGGGLQQKRAEEVVERTGPTHKAFAVENVGKDVADYFTLDRKPIGTGGFATVCKCIEKRTGHERAVKCIVKKKIPNTERLEKEIETMFAMDHPNIIKLFQSFEDNQQIYLVMELCAGGELFDVIVDQGRISEADAAIIMLQIFRALVYMHEAGVCHRDLKPENFLFLKKGPIRGNILKIVDFGIAAHFQAGKPETAEFTSKLGTPYYVAPEVLGRWPRYNEKCDCWSAGVIMYVLFSGILPFKGHNDVGTLQKVILGKYSFPPDAFKGVSEEAKDLIRNLLQKKPSLRFSAKEALKDTWVTKSAPQKNAPLSQAVIQNLKLFSAEHRLKKAALHVLARHQDEAILGQLRDKFLELDENGDGMITLAELKHGLHRAGIDAVAAQELEGLLQAIDADGSGEIDYTEFIAATVERKLVVQESECWAAFRVFDKNDDGRISQSELQEVLSSQEVNNTISKEQIQKILQDVDTNGDGFIDFHEFMEMMRR